MEASEPLILSLETGTAQGGIALIRGAVLEESTGEVWRAENIISEIQAALDRSEMRLSDLDKVAVSLGPGSFTGIRIGIATALGLRRASGVEVIGVNALEALASLWRSGLVTSVMPIGRGRIAVQKFRTDESGPVAESDAETLDERELFERILSSPGTHFIVTTLQAESKLKSELRNAAFENVSIDSSNLAAVIGRFAASVGSTSLEPIYLRS